MKKYYFSQNCHGSALWYAMLVPGLTVALVLIFNSIDQKNLDIVSTTLSSSRNAPNTPPQCLFQCSELLRADSSWPTVTVVKTLCQKNMKCPASHPQLKKRHTQTSMTQENTTKKLHYLWVQEHLCCR